MPSFARCAYDLSNTPMTTPSEAFREQFAATFNRLLDAAGAPRSGHGRTRYVADAFGISTGSAGKWLVGATSPDPSRFRELAAYFGVSLDTLLGGEVVPPALSPLFTDSRSPHDGSAVCDALLSALRPPGLLREARLVPPLPPDYPNVQTLYLLRITSAEMEPYVRAGDIVGYVPVSVIDSDGEYVLSIRGHFIVRRIVRLLDSERLRIMTARPQDLTVDIEPNQLRPCVDVGMSIGPMVLHGKVTTRVLVQH